MHAPLTCPQLRSHVLRWTYHLGCSQVSPKSTSFRGGDHLLYVSLAGLGFGEETTSYRPIPGAGS